MRSTRRNRSYIRRKRYFGGQAVVSSRPTGVAPVTPPQGCQQALSQLDTATREVERLGCSKGQGCDKVVSDLQAARTEINNKMTEVQGLRVDVRKSKAYIPATLSKLAMAAIDYEKQRTTTCKLPASDLSKITVNIVKDIDRIATEDPQSYMDLMELNDMIEKENININDIQNKQIPMLNNELKLRKGEFDSLKEKATISESKVASANVELNKLNTTIRTEEAKLKNLRNFVRNYNVKFPDNNTRDIMSRIINNLWVNIS